MSIGRRAIAEFIGTYWLVFGGTGSAILSAVFLTDKQIPIGIGIAGVALAFGFTLLTMGFAIGHISGCHINPAVTLGLWSGGRFPARDVPLYIVAQILGGIAASATLYAIVGGHPGFALHPNGLAANGYGVHSPGGYGLGAAFLSECVLTAIFLFVILGATDLRAIKGFAPIPIGLCLSLANLVAIPITNASINPARSTAPALFVGDWAVQQLWLFWVAPILGAIVAGYGYRALTGSNAHDETATSSAHRDAQ